MKVIIGAVLAVGLSACTIDMPQPDVQPATVQKQDSIQYSVSFAAVVRRIEPLAERMCRNRVPNANCDFRIFVDSRKGQPANAYQRVEKNGRPEIGFTTALIARARNDDELAFVLGHETAHHISGHLTRTRDTAMAGALLGGLLAVVVGGNATDVDLAQNIGGNVGARAFSKDFELEADRLGTIIAYEAGFDPIRGAQFFTRIPDPGDRFLGTHPQNAARIKTVRRTMAGLS